MSIRRGSAELARCVMVDPEAGVLPRGCRLHHFRWTARGGPVVGRVMRPVVRPWGWTPGGVTRVAPGALPKPCHRQAGRGHTRFPHPMIDETAQEAVPANVERSQTCARPQSGSGPARHCSRPVEPVSKALIGAYISADSQPCRRQRDDALRRQSSFALRTYCGSCGPTAVRLLRFLRAYCGATPMRSPMP